MRRAITSVLVLLTLPAALEAQRDSTLVVGARVRARTIVEGVGFAQRKELSGSIHAWEGDTLVILVSEGLRRFAPQDLTSLSVSLGRKRAVIRDPVFGLLIGLAAASLVSSNMFSDQGSCGVFGCTHDEKYRGQKARSLKRAFVFYGGALGLVSGIRGHEQWREITPDRR